MSEKQLSFVHEYHDPSEEVIKKNALLNIEKNKNLQLNKVDNLTLIEGDQVYDIKSNISNDTNFLYLCFIVDINIYKTYYDKACILIKGIMNDFFNYYQLQKGKLQYEIVLIPYSERSLSKILKAKPDSSLEVFNEMNKAITQTHSSYEKGFISAINALMTLKANAEKFVFIIPNREYDIEYDDQREVDFELREFNIKCEIIYFSEENNRLEKECSQIFGDNMKINVLN